MHPSQWTNYLWCHVPLQYYCIVTAFQWGSLVGSSLTLRLVSTPMIREKWDLLLRRTDRNWVQRSEVTWRLLRDFLWGWPMCRWGGKDWVSSRVGLGWSPRNLVQVAAGRVIACRSHKAQVEFWRQSWPSKKTSVLGILEPTNRQMKGNHYSWVLSHRNGIWDPEKAASSPQSALHSAVSKRHLHLPGMRRSDGCHRTDGTRMDLIMYEDVRFITAQWGEESATQRLVLGQLTGNWEKQ